MHLTVWCRIVSRLDLNGLNVNVTSTHMKTDQASAILTRRYIDRQTERERERETERHGRGWTNKWTRNEDAAADFTALLAINALHVYNKQISRPRRCKLFNGDTKRHNTLYEITRFLTRRAAWTTRQMAHKTTGQRRLIQLQHTV